MTTDQSSPGIGNPDRSTKRRRKQTSCCWFATKAFLFLISGFAIWFAFLVIRNVTKAAKDPHSALFAETVDERGVERAGETLKENTRVIRPLVRKGDKFDIAATVWARTGASVDGKGEEEPVYSDIIFRGVTLQDKGLLTSVKVSVPTKRL